MAIDADKVPAAKPSASGLHLTAIEAAEMKQGAPGKVLFIDIRTRAEAMYLGMPTLVDYLPKDALMTPGVEACVALLQDGKAGRS